MGFKTDAIAYINSVEEHEYFTRAQILISKKVKDSNPARYSLVFSGRVNFYGAAFKQHPLKGQKIRLKEVDVTNAYLDRDGNQCYNKVPNFAVYSYELLQTRQEQAQDGNIAISLDDLSPVDDMPF